MIDGARMHIPDEHAEQFIPLLRQHSRQMLDSGP
jgi:hypothetical protein